MVQAWFWLKRPVWFLEHCSQAYGDVFTMRMPFGMNLVHVADPELVTAIFGDDHEVLRAGQGNAMFLEPLVGPHSVLVLDGPEHLRQRKLILPAFRGDRMRAWEDAIRDITRAQIARWPVGTPFPLRPSMQSITLDVIVRVVFGVDGAARADDLRRHGPVPQRLPDPAARGPVPGPGGLPPGAVRRAAAAGLRLVPVRGRPAALRGGQLRHLRDADRPARGAAGGDAAARLAAAGAGSPGGRDVRPARRRAVRRDRPARPTGPETCGTALRSILSMDNVENRRKTMPLTIGDTAPDFEAETSEGPIRFYDWLGDSWGVLFSHPKDFTPICTTELGYMAKIKPEFDLRGVKIIGLSVDSTGDHERWAADIAETQGTAPNYPLIADHDFNVAKLYGMLPADVSGDAKARTPADNQTVRNVFVIGPDKKMKLILVYPMSTGRNFDEVLRVIDSLQLTAKHKVATPANWKQGEDVIITAAVSNEEADEKFPGYETVKPYLRKTKQPS